MNDQLSTLREFGLTMLIIFSIGALILIGAAIVHALKNRK
jgi:hypothetical protein